MNPLESITIKDKLKDKLIHQYWLIFSLSGVFFLHFTLNSGVTDFFIGACGIFLLVRMVYGDYQFKTIPRNYIVLLAVSGSIILFSLLFSYQHSDTHRIYRIVKTLIIVLSIHCLSRTPVDKRIANLFVALLAFLIILQFTARSLLGMPYGTHSNPHILANFAALVLPVLFYQLSAAAKPYKFLFIPLALLDLDLLLKTGSRPAILALSVSVLFTMIFFVHKRYRWIGLLTILMSFILLYFTGYADTIPKLKELILNLQREERVQFWADTWKMLQDDSLAAWVVGKGIGSFQYYFPSYATPVSIAFTFPHNHFLQILYENGLIGVILVFGGQALLLYSLIKLSKGASDSKSRLFVNCMMVIFLTWFIMSSLTVGFYSKFALYPLGFIMGIVLALPGHLEIRHVFGSFQKPGQGRERSEQQKHEGMPKMPKPEAVIMSVCV